MPDTKSLATLVLGALVVTAPAAASRAQQMPPAMACGFIIRPGMMGRTMPDSTRRLDELQRVMSMPRGQSGAPSDRIRLERTRGWIGVQMTEISETRTTEDGRLVRYCDYPVVVSIEPASPAEKAGLEAGDTVWAYNGVDLRTSGEVALDRLLVPDDTLRFGVRRNGRMFDVPVIVGKRTDGGPTLGWSAVASGPNGYSYIVVSPGGPGAPRAAMAPQGAPLPPNAPIAPRGNDEGARVRVIRRNAEGALAPMAPMAPLPPAPPMLFSFGVGASALAGAQLVTMDDDLRAVVGAKGGGVLVLKVADGTPASESGLRAGDVIVSAAGRPVAAPSALQQIFLRDADNRTLALRVQRKGKVRDVTLRW